MRNLLIGLALCLLAAGSVLADDAEAIFAKAFAYTVQVRTSIELGFVEDEQGVGFGAGFVVDRARGWVMTNAHVASHSPARIEVAFGLGRFAPARRVYVDPFIDLAILEVADRCLPASARPGSSAARSRARVTRSAPSGIPGGSSTRGREASCRDALPSLAAR